MVADVEVVGKILVERDEQVVELLDEADVSAGNRPEGQETSRQGSAVARRATADETAPRLSLSPGARSLLHHLRNHRLAELRREAQALIDRRSHLERESENVERALSITPEDEGISEFLERLRAATERLDDSERRGETTRRIDRRT